MTAPDRFIAVHCSADTSLACGAWVLGPEEATACASAVELLRVLQQLHDARRTALDAALEEARAAGYAAGRKEALQAVTPGLLQAWEHTAQRLSAHMSEMHRESRQAVIDWSCHIVQRIADGLAPADVVAALAARAADEIPPERKAIVFVHPCVAVAVREHLASRVGPHDDHPTLEVQADPELNLFDCRIDTPAGRWLAGLRTQLLNISQRLAP